jgi:RNA recognition motif-containing protein
VLSIDIKRDKQTGRNLGYGFIQMSSHAEAVNAKAQLQETEISGRKIRIGWAQRNTALFVGTCTSGFMDDQRLVARVVSVGFTSEPGWVVS